jgi:hypothetical protein
MAMNPTNDGPDATPDQMAPTPATTTTTTTTDTVERPPSQLQPDQLLAQALDSVLAAFGDLVSGQTGKLASDARKGVTEAGTALIDAIRKNPMLAAALALGINWLLSQRSRSREGVVNAQQRDPIFALLDAVRSNPALLAALAIGLDALLAQMRKSGGRPGTPAGNVASSLGELGTQAGQQAHDVLTWLGNLTEENRLAVGALALLVGVLVGASLPVTAAERTVASEARDAITRSVQTVMADVLRQLNDVAQAVLRQPASKLPAQTTLVSES